MAAAPGLRPDVAAAEDRVGAAVELVCLLGERGIVARMLGGSAVVLHCPSLGGRPHRAIADVDLIVTKQGGRKLPDAMRELGYQSTERFNAMHGDVRMIFGGPAGKVDVFVDEFRL